MVCQKKLNMFVCLTYPQYVIADLFAQKRYKEFGEDSFIIIKYVNIKKIKKNKYAKYFIIKRSCIGKIITGLFSYFPFCMISRNKDITLYYFNDRDPISAGIGKISKKIILIEEGMGTYYAEPGISVIGETISPDIVYVGYPELYRETHSYSTKIIKINYKKLYSRRNMNFYFGQKDFHISGDLLILGQASKTSQQLRIYEVNFINTLLEKFPNKRIIIKPHPSDLHPEEYNNFGNFLVIGNDMNNRPIESIMYHIDCGSYFSLFSSAGITIANIFPKRKVIFGIGIYDIGFDNISLQLKNFSEYLNNIYFPNSIEDIIKILNW